MPIIGTFAGNLYRLLLELKANWVIGKNKTVPVLEISLDFKIKNPYFTYQDMTWYGGLVVNNLRKNHPFIVEAGGQKFFSQKELCQKIKYQKKVRENCRASFFMSQWVAAFTKEECPNMKEKICFVGGGANLDVTKIDVSKKKGNKFLFVGRDFRRKAGDLVIEAFKVIRDQYSENMELHIAGPTDLNISEKNIFTYGDADNQTVNDLMNKCDVFVMPSRFEAYGLVFAEALIHGMPCIGRNLFEMPYFIQDGVNGRLILDDDSSFLAKTMYATITDAQMIRFVQKHQNEYIDKYSWNSVASRIAEVIEKLT